MGTSATAHRFVATLVILAGLLLGVVQSAVAQTPGMRDGEPVTQTRQSDSQELRGWERTALTRGRPDGGQVNQLDGFHASAYAPRGWEATSGASGSQQTAGRDQHVNAPTRSLSLSPTLLYVAAVVAALAVTFATARLLRSSDGRHRVA